MGTVTKSGALGAGLFGGGAAGGATTPEVKTPTAMTGTVMSITSPIETITVSGSTTLTRAAGTPAQNTTLETVITVTGGLPVTLTFPSAYDEAQKTSVTSCVLQPGVTTLQWVYRADGWYVFGAPAPNAYTVSTRPAPAVAGEGAVIIVKDGPWAGPMVVRGGRWCGVLTAQMSIPGILLPSGTINVGASGNLTVGTALQAVHEGGAWCYLPAIASTPAVAAGLYYVVFSSTTLGTIYSNGPGSAPLNFSAGLAYTAPLATDVNLFVPRGGTPHVDGIMIPGGLLGPDGSAVFTFTANPNNTAGTKHIKTKLGATEIHAQTALSTGGARGTVKFNAVGLETKQAYYGSATSTGAFTDTTSGFAPTIMSHNMLADVRFGFFGRNITVATDYVAAYDLSLTLVCE